MSDRVNLSDTLFIMGKKTDNNHKYYINKDGERVLRVSDVIKVLAKEQLIIWANMLGFKGVSYKKELERTANIGSLCHDVIEKYFNPRYVADIDYDGFDIPENEDRIEVRNALTSFTKWYTKFIKTHTYNIVFTEKVVVGKNFGGTIDCGIEGWKDPKKVIFVDYKTSSDFHLTQFLQLAGYTIIYEEEHGENSVEGAMICRLNKKGGIAEARYIPRDQMNPFIICFQCMYDVAVGTHILNENLRELTERI